MKFRAKTTVALLFPALLGACAEAQLVIHGAKEITGSTEGQAKSKGDYKIGNPYRIAGTWYYPAEDYGYVETGTASWYGPKFHGRRTANGETYDMNDLTAAHRTLPMPSMVRVVNLRNGRSVMLRVNDRGPFARGRIIDVSRRAAQLLGFQKQGTTRVRVEIVPEESRRLKYIALNGKEPPKMVPVAEALPQKKDVAKPITVAAAGNERVVASGTVSALGPELFIQAGAYSDRSNATRVKALLIRYGAPQVMETTIGAQRLYRVRLGPMNSLENADDTLAKVIGAGFPNARIVVE